MSAHTDPHGPRVVLIGPPGAGKTTIGRKLARELDVELYDTDAGIEETARRSIAEIFAADGEPGFRRLEEEVVGRALRTEQGVVSLGGGAVLSEKTRALLRECTVVYLEISIAEGLRRTGATNTRPLLGGTDPGTKYRELMRSRRPLYREVASVRVRTDGRSPGRVVRAIMGKLGLEPVHPETMEAGLPADAAPQRTSRSRARRRARARARRAAAAQQKPAGASPAGIPAEDAGANDAGRAKPAEGKGSDTTGAPAHRTESTDTGLRTPGRSRRARARRARARRQQHEQAEQTQAEQKKTGTEQSR
ncbi:shikimate kinase [Nocardia speluncae]|uniref:Shikimate kinase n=1 Tax=Nocardia speluncae TaxID=419477 RepID=A0A846X907_9NOCA|nr:shikimate kinase [Nocardia speluncae]